MGIRFRKLSQKGKMSGIKLGNPHQKIDNIGMKSTGITSRVDFRRKKIAAQKDLKEADKNLLTIKSFINECVAELLEMNKIPHDHYKEEIVDGIFTLYHYIVVPEDIKDEILNIIKASFNMMMDEKDFDIEGIVEVRFLSAVVN